MKLYFLILFFFAFVHVNGSVRPNVLFIVSDDQGWGDFPSNWDGTEVQLPVWINWPIREPAFQIIIRFPFVHLLGLVCLPVNIRLRMGCGVVIRELKKM